MNVTAHPAPVLEARGLVKHYGPVVALDGVDLRVHAGEAVAIMGASGSGKTTLLHCLAAIVAPDAGSVRLTTPATAPVELAGMSEADRSAVRRTRLGFVFQEHLLLPELSAVENAALPLLLAGAPRAHAEQHAAAWLAALGLAGLEQRRIGELSGGQAQRVAIARAQVTGAPVVFADEPTGALDSATSREVLDALLHATVAQGRSLVVVTHDAEVARRCHRVLHMRDGRIVDDGTGRADAAPATPASVRVAPAAPPVPSVPAHIAAGADR